MGDDLFQAEPDRLEQRHLVGVGAHRLVFRFDCARPVAVGQVARMHDSAPVSDDIELRPLLGAREPAYRSCVRELHGPPLAWRWHCADKPKPLA